MYKQFLSLALVSVSLAAGASTKQNTVTADTTPNVQMLRATKLNLESEIVKLKSTAKLSVTKQNRLISLQTQDANITAQVSAIDAKQALLKQEAIKQAKLAAAKLAATKAANLKAAQATQTTTTQPVQHQSSTLPSTGSINMNQTSGYVDINAVANWLATNKGTYDASYWAYIISRESNGLVDAQNASSGAYGILQLYGHGEWRGMTLGQQLQMAMPLPASAWYLY